MFCVVYGLNLVLKILQQLANLELLDVQGWLVLFWDIPTFHNWCERGKKFAVSIMSARYSRKILVYILIHLIKKARGAAFIWHMCITFGFESENS